MIIEQIPNHLLILFLLSADNANTTRSIEEAMAALNLDDDYGKSNSL